jgi:hypothetical protein
MTGLGKAWRAGGGVRGTRQYVVWVDVPRASGWRAWNAAAGGFEERLSAQVSGPVLDAQIDSETRQGQDYVRVRVSVTVEAAVVAAAVSGAWVAFRAAAGEIGGWDLAAATAQARPAAAPPPVTPERRRRRW